MTRWSLLTGKRALRLGIALVVLAAPRIAAAQAAQAAPAAAQDDILKFKTSAPAIIVNQIKADKTAEFEDGWASIRALLAKSEDPDLKAFGETLTSLYRVDQDPFDTAGGKAVIYIFQLSAPSTTYSYNPTKILFEALKAGKEGSSITDADARVIFDKLQSAYVAINPPWHLVKAK